MWEMKNLFAGIAVTIFALFGVATIIKGDGEPYVYICTLLLFGVAVSFFRNAKR
ncbi:MAG: hypothetical protein ACLRWH_05455 [Emergencia sp.]